MKTPFAESGMRGGKSPVRGVRAVRATNAASRTILLITNDKGYHENLRSLANTIGFFVVKATRISGTVAILQATRPIVVLLDLDLPDEAAWQMADIILNEPRCPAVILLSGRTAQFDFRTAIRAGSIVSKNESPGRPLEMIQERLHLPPSANQAEWNASQRVLIRWLRPSGWAQATSGAHRF
jgi:CheY-like chemotaxis protein